MISSVSETPTSRPGRRPRAFKLAHFTSLGYDREAVDAFLAEAEHALTSTPPTMAPYEIQDARFPAVRWSRGYDMRAVDERGKVVAEEYLRSFYDTAYSRPELGTELPLVGTLGELVPGSPAALRSSPVRIGDIFGAMLHGNLVHTSTALIRRSRLVAGGDACLLH